MNEVDRQRILSFLLWVGVFLFTLLTFLTSEIKYGYLSIAFAILYHSEEIELRYRRNEKDE